MEYFSQSESVKNLALSLSKFQGDLEGVSKDSKNPHYKSKYASIDAILSVVNPLLSKHGLSFVCMPYGQDGVLCQLMHSSGEFMRSLFISKIKDESDPQKRGGAITYARRYCMAAWLGISQDDDDGQAASQPAKPQPKPNQEAQLKPNPAEGFDHLILKEVQDLAKFMGGANVAKDEVEGFIKAKFNLENMRKLHQSHLSEVYKFIEIRSKKGE